MSPREAYLTGMREALRFRLCHHVGRTDAVCAIDVAMSAGTDVLIQELPSIDGLYANQSPPRIILSSLRPPGRRAFTCAHELGHHTLGHGARIDEYVAEGTARRQRAATEERQATAFAGFLLMPLTAIDNAFHLRNWSPTDCAPEQLYAIANWFGVSYTGLVDHLSLALGRMPLARAEKVKKFAPKQLRAALLSGGVTASHLVLVDMHWHDRAVDVEVGDAIVLPAGCKLTGARCEIVAESGDRTTVVATRPGLGQVSHSPSGWAAFIRVARAGFTGRACYRHLEDEDA